MPRPIEGARLSARRRGLVALLVGALVVAVLLGNEGASASESGPTDVLLSRDGVSFSTALDGGIFAGRGAIVPGQSETASLWIRNPSDAAAVFRVSLRELRVPSSAWATGSELTVSDSGSGTARTTKLGDLATCAVVVPTQQVASGGTVRVDITIAMGDWSGSTGQGETVSAAALVAMRDAAAGAFASSACTDDGVLVSSNPRVGSTLANTGSEPPTLLIAFGGVLVGVGVFFLAARRRGRADES